MNTIYRIVFNAATGTWVVASELAKGPKKKASKTALAATFAALWATAGGLHAQGYAAGTSANASPVGNLNNGNCYLITNAIFNCKNNVYGAAVGSNAVAGNGSVAFGDHAQTDGNFFATAVGGYSHALPWATAVGASAMAEGQASVAIGLNSKTALNAFYTVAIGSSALASGTTQGAVALGANSNSTNGSVALGSGATASNGGGAWSALAAGQNSKATGDGAAAVGSSASAAGVGALAMGRGATTAYNYGTAIGSGANAGQSWGIALGQGARTLLNGSGAGYGSMAIGTNALATGIYNIALGQSAVTDGASVNSIAMGTSAHSSNAYAIAIEGAASGDHATAIGSGANAAATYSLAIGQQAVASATANNSVGLGYFANVSAANAVALGSNSVANVDNTVSVGSSTNQRKIVNVAAGTQANDAVNVSQLNPLVSALGGNASINPTTGAVTGPTYTLDGNNYTNVGAALLAINAKSGAGNPLNVAYDDEAKDVVTLLGKNGTQIKNVADAQVDSDAVNLGQLKSGLTGATRYFKANGLNDGTDDASATGARSVAVGAGAAATGSDAIAMGSGASASGTGSLAIGQGASATGPDGITEVIAIGARSSVSGTNSNAFGAGANVEGVASDAFGSGATVSASGSVAVGYQATATGANSVALGAFSLADRDNVVSVGDSTLRRKIVNLDAGIAATDAVNVSQLQGITNALGGGATVNPISGEIVPPDYTVQQTLYRDVGGAVVAIDDNLTAIHGTLADTVVYDDGVHNSLTLGGVSGQPPVALRNVADGAVHLTSTDAINGSQLFGVSNSLANALGGNAGVDGRGYVTAPSYTFDGTNYSTVGLALDAINNFAAQSTSNTASTLSAMNAQISTFDAKITDVNNQLTQVQSRQSKVATAMTATDPVNDGQSLVQQATAGENVTVGKDTDGAAIDFADKDGNTRTLSNVSAGVADTDAVNMGQLKSAGLVDSDGTMLDAMVYDPGSNRGSVTLGGVGAAAPVVLTNVADGKNQYDAVNVGQLTGVQSDLQNQINSVNNQVTSIDGRVTHLESNGARSDASDAAAPVPADAATVAAAANGAGVTLGTNAQSTAESGTAVGQSAQASGNHATAVAANASATGANATAIGAGANASADNSVALGANSVATQANSVSVGSAGNERTVTNVAAGVARTDAANWGQVQDAVNGVQDWAKQRFTQLDKRINSMGAMSAAYGQMAFSAQGIDQPNKVGVGVGTQNGQSAIAVGYSRQIKPNFNVSFGGSASANDVSVGVGMAVGW
ncbi:ESPR-type extended signal peptide-containing protein [Dyella monticola]|nr:ESPR-type extended signal peptide-containing protein [Dyella monticola]